MINLKFGLFAFFIGFCLIFAGCSNPATTANNLLNRDSTGDLNYNENVVEDSECTCDGGCDADCECGCHHDADNDADDEDNEADDDESMKDDRGRRGNNRRHGNNHHGNGGHGNSGHGNSGHGNFRPEFADAYTKGFFGWDHEWIIVESGINLAFVELLKVDNAQTLVRIETFGDIELDAVVLKYANNVNQFNQNKKTSVVEILIDDPQLMDYLLDVHGSNYVEVTISLK